MGSTIELQTADGPMGLYETEAPDGRPRGAVVVIQEAFGVNDHIEDVTRRFAAADYHAVAPHLFHRSGDPQIGYEHFDEAMQHIGALSVAGLTEDVDLALDHLRAAGFGDTSIAIVGFCMGGNVALQTGARVALGAAVSFYGGGVVEGRFGAAALVDVAPNLQSPWLGLYGEQDEGIPLDQVARLREAASRAPVPTKLVTYPDAGHGFHCDARSAFHPPSAEDAWSQTLAWLGEHVEHPTG